MNKNNLMNKVKQLKAVIEGNRRRREHVLRCITVRTNDGTNQCIPVGSWAILLKRLNA
jgi:hypothetical protein